MYNLIEHSSKYFESTGSLWFYSKDEATIFNVDIPNTDNFKPFKYNAKLLENTVAQHAPNDANGILKNVPLKYLSTFWRLLEIPLINCKVELKLKQLMYCVSSAASADNVNGNASDSIIYQRHKLYVPVVNVSARDNQKYQNFLENDLKDQFIGMNVKQKEMIKIWQINLNIFSNQNLLELIDCLFYFI